MAPDRCRIAGWRSHPEGLFIIPNSIDTRDHGGNSTTERQPADYLEEGPREAASARSSRCTMRRRYPRSMRYALRQLSHRVVKCVIAHGIVLEAVFPQCGQVMETTSVSAIGTAPSPVFTRASDALVDRPNALSHYICASECPKTASHVSVRCSGNIAVNSISWDRQLHSGRNCQFCSNFSVHESWIFTHRHRLQRPPRSRSRRDTLLQAKSILRPAMAA